MKQILQHSNTQESVRLLSVNFTVNFFHCILSRVQILSTNIEIFNLSALHNTKKMDMICCPGT